MGLVKRTYVDGETVITAANLNDIQDAIIQNEEDITTKGTYSKPSGGIPSTDLASAVQTSLGKADTALQSSDIDSTLAVTGKAADAKKTGDEISDVKNTLNHKADAIYDTASGDIASFPDGADGLPVKDLTVGIEPVQAGTGDPSPTNVRPISGWTGANVSRAGKNLLDTISQYWMVGQYIDANGDVQRSSGYKYLDLFIPVSGNAYTLQLVYESTDQIGMSIAEYDNGYNFLQRNLTMLSGLQLNSLTVTLRSDTKYIKISSMPKTLYNSVMLEKGSSPTAYEPYVGTTIPITFHDSQGDPLTVYGGTLDVTSGVLTVTHIITDLGNYEWSYNPSWNGSGGFYIYTYSPDVNIDVKFPSNEDIAVNAICSRYQCVSRNTLYSNPSMYGFCIGPNGAFTIRDHNYSDGASFTTAMSGVQLVYELANPQSYQLTVQQLTTLLGENNIWADCGPSTVEYPCDTKLYVSKKMEEIENLRKTIAPIEDGDTASQLYGQGRYFFRNGNFCKAKTDILQNAQFTLNTNYEVTSVANELYDAINQFSV